MLYRRHGAKELVTQKYSSLNKFSFITLGHCEVEEAWGGSGVMDGARTPFPSPIRT